MSGIARKLFFALSMLVVFAAFTSLASATIAGPADSLAQETEELETEGELLPDLEQLDSPAPLHAKPVALAECKRRMDDVLKAGIFPDIVTPPPL